MDNIQAWTALEELREYLAGTCTTDRYDRFAVAIDRAKEVLSGKEKETCCTEREDL